MTTVEDKFFEASKRYPEFTKGDIEVFVEAFNTFDKDGNGVIDGHELPAFLKNMGQGSTEKDIKFLVGRFSAKGADYIDINGFLEMMRYFYPLKRVEFVHDFVEPAAEFPEFTRNDFEVFLETFREFDEDESGTIDTFELKKLLRSMGQGCSDDRLKQIMDKFGKNGAISWTGFLEIMRSFYPEKRRAFERQYYEPAKKFPEFSKSDIDVFIQNFRDFDLDGNGSIDTDELGIAFKRMGQGCTSDQLDAIMAEFDTDGNGSIEWPEFLSVMRSFYPHKLAEFEEEFYGAAKKYPEFGPEDIEIFIEAFREYDLDGNGNIDADELDKAFKAMGQGCTRERLQQIIKEVDANGNGTIEWNEFLEIMKNIYFGKWANQTKSSTSSPAPAAKPAAAAPQPSGGFKPATTTASATRSVGFGAHRGGNSGCAVCGKTVYPTESISAVNQTFHRGCFKCMEPGCGLTLTLKNFFGHGTQVFCANHVPKNKATQGLDVTTQNALSAPKLKSAQGVKKDARMTFAPGQLKAVNPDDPEPQE